MKIDDTKYFESKWKKVLESEITKDPNRMVTPMILGPTWGQTVSQVVKEMVKDNKKVKFSFYRNEELWYNTECGFEFPVPTSDIGDACFLAEDKALLFMRYIRKHVECIRKAQVEQIEETNRNAKSVRLGDLTAKCDSNAPLTQEDKLWINSSPVGKEEI
jgi:hypothetical protein